MILTLTMAAATIAFSIVDAVVFRALPYAEPDRLVSIQKPRDQADGGGPASPAEYFDWREGSQALEAVATASGSPPMTLAAGASTERLTVQRVSTNLFALLGVRPAAGRVFDAGDERPGSPAVAIMSHELWQRRFGGDRAVIGRIVEFDKGPREIAGVLPAGVWYPMTSVAAPDLYIPYIPAPADRANNRARSMNVVGRLRAGLSLDQARADLARISPAVVTPLHDHVVGPRKNAFLLVLVAVGVVLLVGALNVASLLLARTATRAREFGTRLALGSSRRRLVGSLMLEGLMLALAAGVGALVIAYWGIGFAASSLPPGISRVSTVRVDARVAGVAIAVAILCGLIVSLAPAILASRNGLSECLKGSGGAVLGSRRRERALGTFLVADVAFVTTLLAATVLVVSSFVFVTTADLGFDRRNVMSLGFGHTDVLASRPPGSATVLHTSLLERVRSVDGVVDAAVAAGAPPLSGARVGYAVTLPGQPTPEPDDYWETNFVTAGYFGVMGIPLVDGRLIDESDVAGAPRVSVINEAAARRFFPDRDPLGQTLLLNGPSTIVGVVRAVHFEGPEHAARPAVYMPVAQQSFQLAMGILHVRTARDPRLVAEPVREALRPVVGAALTTAMFIDDDFQRLTAGRRFNAMLMTAFGIVAVAIGALGVYGTMAFVVARRVREIGLRMALGATPWNVLGLVLRNALGRVSLGAAIGLAGTWAASGLMTSFVFGIQPTDPRVYAAVAALLGGVGLAAALVPALRASRLDPLTVMRHE